jgi:hypothetical protein
MCKPFDVGNSKKPAQHQARVGRQTSRETPKVKDFDAVEGLKSARSRKQPVFRAGGQEQSCTSAA